MVYNHSDFICFAYMFHIEHGHHQSTNENVYSTDMELNQHSHGGYLNMKGVTITTKSKIRDINIIKRYFYMY